MSDSNPTRGLISEKALMQSVIDLARHTGWLVYHTHDSRRSEPGYPDLDLVNPGRGMALHAELKSDTGRLEERQIAWIDAMRECGRRVEVWSPTDWVNGNIEAVLTGKRTS